jgi:indole-3-glycerol phosphate synthase
VIVVEGLEDEDGRLERLYEEALELGLDCVVETRDEDELQLALERVDPEILLLSARRADADHGLEHVLGLLPDVPAGKLAVAELAAADRADVRELERAGVDAVIVGFADVAALAGGHPGEG